MLFHCHAFCQVARLVNVAAPQHRHVIGEKLQRHHQQHGDVSKRQVLVLFALRDARVADSAVRFFEKLARGRKAAASSADAGSEKPAAEQREGEVE